MNGDADLVLVNGQALTSAKFQRHDKFTHFHLHDLLRWCCPVRVPCPSFSWCHLGQKRVGRTKRRRISRCKGHHKLSRACERSRHQTCSVAGTPPYQKSLMPTTSPLRIRRNAFWKSTDIFCDQLSWISAAERFPSIARLGGPNIARGIPLDQITFQVLLESLPLEGT